MTVVSTLLPSDRQTSSASSRHPVIVAVCRAVCKDGDVLGELVAMEVVPSVGGIVATLTTNTVQLVEVGFGTTMMSRIVQSTVVHVGRIIEDGFSIASLSDFGRDLREVLPTVL